jgi:hypothetical protein
MSYATKEDVKSMFRDFADNSEAAVDDNELDLFIANSASIIDAKIGTLYQMPVTEADNPESFKILKQLQMFKVACIVDDILNSYGEADKKPMWCKKGEALLNALVPPINPKTCRQCPPTMQLPDTPYLGTSTQRGRINISATSGTVIKKNSDNW